MHLLDFSLDKWDYWTFAFLLVAIVAFFYAVIQIGGLPGKIAERRHHPRAEAVKIVGWIGLFTVFPWIHAIIWSIHDGLTIDVRTLPKDGDGVDVGKEIEFAQADTVETPPETSPAPPSGTPGPSA